MDIGYESPITRKEWRERLCVLLSALLHAGNPNPFSFLINDLTSEFLRANF